jgi:hypothetical protein
MARSEACKGNGLAVEVRTTLSRRRVMIRKRGRA